MRETNTKELLSVYFDRQWRSILEGEAVNVYNCIILCNLQVDSHWLAIYILTPILIKSTHIFDATCRESSKSWQLPASCSLIRSMAPVPHVLSREFADT